MYAKRHGYKLINGNSLIDASRGAAWSKLYAMEQSLPNFDYVMYMDMDAVIMNMDKNLERLSMIPIL